MEQTGKVPEVAPIAPPEVSVRDTAELMNPGVYFNDEVRQNLIQNYRGLFTSRAQFYANFDKFLSYRKDNKKAETTKLLKENYQLSIATVSYTHLTLPTNREG